MVRIDIGRVREAVGDRVADLLVDVASDLVNYVKLEAPVHSGDLRRSWQILRTGDDEVVVGSTLAHAVWVQTGRRPHPNDPSRWPPIRPLKVWVRRKLNAEPAVAYAVRHTIGTEGIEPNPYVTRATRRLEKRYR